MEIIARNEALAVFISQPLLAVCVVQPVSMAIFWTLSSKLYEEVNDCEGVWGMEKNIGLGVHRDYVTLSKAQRL